MRESYGTLFDRFWDGPTGREIQARGKDAVIAAVYLLSNKHANMLGLYELPIVTVAHYLPVFGPSIESRLAPLWEALAALRDVEFAYYDTATSFVWVREMARIRMQLEHGERLAAGDKRVGAIARLYAGLKPNPFLGPFHSRYAKDLRLRARRDVAGSPSGGPSEQHGPSKGHPSPSEARNSQQSTETGNRQQATGSGSAAGSTTGLSAAAQTPRRFRDPQPRTPAENVEVITQVVLKDVIPLGVTEDDLVETTKARCAALHIEYDSSAVRKAIDSALEREGLRS